MSQYLSGYFLFVIVLLYHPDFSSEQETTEQPRWIRFNKWAINDWNPRESETTPEYYWRRPATQYPMWYNQERSKRTRKPTNYWNPRESETTPEYYWRRPVTQYPTWHKSRYISQHQTDHWKYCRYLMNKYNSREQLNYGSYNYYYQLATGSPRYQHWNNHAIRRYLPRSKYVLVRVFNSEDGNCKFMVYRYERFHRSTHYIQPASTRPWYRNTDYLHRRFRTVRPWYPRHRHIVPNYTDRMITNHYHIKEKECYLFRMLKKIFTCEMGVMVICVTSFFFLIYLLISIINKIKFHKHNGTKHNSESKAKINPSFELDDIPPKYHSDDLKKIIIHDV